MYFRSALRTSPVLLAIAAMLLCAGLSPAAPRSAAQRPAAKPSAARLIRTPAEQRAEELARILDAPDTGQFLRDSVVLARFDQKHITVGDFRREFFAIFSGNRPDRDSLGRVSFLNALISKELLGPAARKVGYDIGYEGRVQMKEYTQRVLSNTLFRKAVVESSQVTEADIVRVHGQFKHSPHVRRIVFADLATAQRVRLDLLAGRVTWKDAFRKYSKLGEAGTDGEFGWLSRASLDPGLAETVYALKPGGITPVMETAAGPQIMQCVEIREVSTPSLEGMRYAIKNELINLRVQVGAATLQQLMRDHMSFVPDTANLRFASRFFSPAMSMSHEGGQAALEFNISLPVFSPGDTSRVLAKWNGGQMSLGRFLIEYRNIPALSRPSVDSPEKLELQVANIALEPYKAQAAIDRGYDKDPVIHAQIESHLEGMMVERMFDDSVSAYVQVSKAERRREYEAHPEIYRVTEERRFAAIGRRSQASADSVVAMLRAGRNATDIIAADSAAGLIGSSIQSQHEDEHGQMHRMVFEEMKPGDITTYSDRSGAATAVQLLDVLPARSLRFEEVENELDELLRVRKSEGRLQAWIKRLSRGHRIETHPELLMKIDLVERF